MVKTSMCLATHDNPRLKLTGQISAAQQDWGSYASQALV